MDCNNISNTVNLPDEPINSFIDVLSGLVISAPSNKNG